MASSETISFASIESDQRTLHSLISAIDTKIAQLKFQIEDSGTMDQPGVATTSKSIVKAVSPPTPPPILAEESSAKSDLPSRRPDADALELKFGQVWFVRIGILLLITALIYGSKLAYTHLVTAFPAGGKAALCFLFSGSLLGLGHWLSRKAGRTGSAETLKNYARVVSGGGLAALYFTTYAIHRIEPLRVIESPVIAGLLLLACALGTLIYALKKKSRTVASTAVALGYYAAMSGPAGGFSLFSTLLLTGLGVAFLFRARWGAIGFLCLCGTYAALFYWHFLQPDALPIGLPYLAAYWAFFTAGAILPKPSVLENRQRLTFASANNALAFIFGSISILGSGPDLYGRFCLTFGALLLGLFTISRPPLTQAFLAKGLAAITIGWIALCDGYQLALVLGIQSAVLFAARVISARQGETSHSPILPIASLLATTLATFVAVTSTTVPIASGIALAAITLALAHAWNRFPHPITTINRIGSILCSIAVIALAATLTCSHLPEDSAFIAVLTTCCTAIGLSLWRPAKLPHLQFVAGLAGVIAPLFLTKLFFHTAYLATPALAALSIYWSRATLPKNFSAARHLPSALGAIGFYFFLLRLISEAPPITQLIIYAGLAPLFAFSFATTKLRCPSLTYGAFILYAVAALMMFSKIPAAASLLLPISLLAHAEVTRRSHQQRLTLALQIAAALALCGSALLISPTYATLGIFIAALVLFAAGFLLRRNDTRRIALGTISIALTRMLLIDLWQFGTAGRVITLFALGAGLLALGYLYNRHPSSLKKLL